MRRSQGKHKIFFWCISEIPRKSHWSKICLKHRNFLPLNHWWVFMDLDQIYLLPKLKGFVSAAQIWWIYILHGRRLKKYVTFSLNLSMIHFHHCYFLYILVLLFMYLFLIYFRHSNQAAAEQPNVCEEHLRDTNATAEGRTRCQRYSSPWGESSSEKKIGHSQFHRD